jgi:hypothetical protein
MCINQRVDCGRFADAGYKAKEKRGDTGNGRNQVRFHFAMLKGILRLEQTKLPAIQYVSSEGHQF